MNQTKSERVQSYYYGMRKFHNAIKRNLYNKYTSNIDNLLEIASGKSGDISKAIDNKVKNIYGYDINEQSILEGKRRVSELKNKTKGFFPNVTMQVKDLSNEIIEEKDFKFDVVSAQFCFHYFFESTQTFETVMKSIENNLKDGGYFIGTLFDGESIETLLKSNRNQLELSDIEGEVRFKIVPKTRINSNSTFGNKISVFIKDTVLDEAMDEYLVYFNTFVDIMKTRGFTLVETQMFEELYKDYFKLDDISKQVSFLNRTFVFKRTKTKFKPLKQMCKQITEYLVECKFETFEEQVLEKYKKAITHKMDNLNNDKLQIYNDYKFIRDNFENFEKVMTDDDISRNIKDYFKIIHNMYLSTLAKDS